VLGRAWAILLCEAITGRWDVRGGGPHGAVLRSSILDRLSAVLLLAIPRLRSGPWPLRLRWPAPGAGRSPSALHPRLQTLPSDNPGGPIFLAPPARPTSPPTARRGHRRWAIATARRRLHIGFRLATRPLNRDTGRATGRRSAASFGVPRVVCSCLFRRSRRESCARGACATSSSSRPRARGRSGQRQISDERLRFARELHGRARAQTSR